MAAALAERAGDRLGIEVSARSAGTLGITDKPAHPRAVAVCREVGIDLTAHRSQGISEELIAWADRVLVMELDQATHLRTYYPSVGDKVLLLGPFGGVADIPDPIGGWIWRFRGSRRLIEACVEGLLRRVG